MAWTCKVCDTDVDDDTEDSCPACEMLKTSWTIGEATRTFEIPAKKFQVLRGQATRAASPDDPAYGPDAWVATKLARVLSKDMARQLPKQGKWPAPQDLVWVIVAPSPGTEPEATLEIIYGQQESAEQGIPGDAGTRDEKGTWAAPIAFVHGEGEVPEIPGVVVVDLTEDSAFAPSVEIRTLSSRVQELQTEAGVGPGQHCLPGALFAYNSAFPRPGVAAHLSELAERASQDPGERLAVFGHTDPVGSDASNKTLSDQRAQAVVSLLTGDLAGLDAVADPWTLADYQATLRALGCDPGAIDGIQGPMTKAATRAFQEEYNAGIHHPDAAPTHPALAVDGLVGPKTHAALRDAYLTWATPQLDAARLGGAGAAGCSEFNPVGDDDAANRRVTLAFFPEADAGSPPCVAGDAAACAVDDGGRFRCSYYRELVGETEDEAPPVSPFFDYGWLKESDGSVHLSAITTLPDETPCTITVHRAPASGLPTDSTQATAPPELGGALAELEATVQGGVCHATWEPAGGEDPFALGLFLDTEADDTDDSDADLDAVEEGEESAEDDAAESSARPYLFRIEGDGVWGVSGPPSVRLDRLIFVDGVDAEGLGVRPDGSAVRFLVEGGRVAERDVVVAIGLSERLVEVLSGEATQ